MRVVLWILLLICIAAAGCLFLSMNADSQRLVFVAFGSWVIGIVTGYVVRSVLALRPGRRVVRRVRGELVEPSRALVEMSHD
ncbi:MAG: hypothetical protein M1546_16265 [Chloroflexi bacterium]|nr:hypothetical protein [Chloroflexota bacterium]